jgi:hypothetical protein
VADTTSLLAPLPSSSNDWAQNPASLATSPPAHSL